MRLFTSAVLAGGIFLAGPLGEGRASMAETVQPDPAPSLAEADALFEQGRFEEAAALYEKIVETRPENVRAWFQLGYSRHVTGDLDKAIPAHKKAASLAPDGSQFKFLGLYNLGCAYALQGKKDEAFAELMRAVDAGFHTQANVLHIRTDSDLDSLRDDPRFGEFVGAMRAHNRTDDLKRFDFWVGDWDVYNADGELVGHNTITAGEGGLVLHEKWRGAGGGTGQSLNYFDPVEDQWKQVWVDAEGVLETSGTWEDGAMRFEGERKFRNGQVRRHRMVFTPNEDGSVRQLIHQSDDGEDWELEFDGLYVPAGSPAPGGRNEGGQAAGAAANTNPPAAPPGRELVGLWDMVVDQDGGAAIEARLSFRLDDGTIRGEADAMGAVMPLEEIALDGGSLRMRLTAPDARIYLFEGTVRANAIEGTWEDDGGVRVSTRAKRADI